MTTGRWYDATVVSAGPVAERAQRIEIDIPGCPQADPGAHIDVQVSIDGAAAIRSYSVVESTRGQLVVTVARAHPGRGGSAFMHALVPGDGLRTTWPIQNFPLSYDRPRYLLLAGGIGITALLAMGRRLRERGADYRFVYAGRSRPAMAYLSEVVADHGERLTAHVGAEQGRLDVPGLVAGCDGQTTAYVCGPIGLMEAAAAAWDAAGLPRTNLRFETFGNSGRFPAEKFRVRIPRLGIETIVDPTTTMLDALQAAGAELMYDCLRGECGLCVVKVLDVRGVIDHRDVFLSERQRRSGTTLCTCVARIAGSGGSPGCVDIDVP